MTKKGKPWHKAMIALVRAHGDRNEVAFHQAAGDLIDALEKEGEDTDELTHLLGKNLAKMVKGHSLAQERPCNMCGDIDGCHLWRIKER